MMFKFVDYAQYAATMFYHIKNKFLFKNFFQFLVMLLIITLRLRVFSSAVDSKNKLCDKSGKQKFKSFIQSNILVIVNLC